MARVENATAALPYSAISGTGGSAEGRPQVLAVEPVPTAHCPRMRMNPTAKQGLDLLKREVGSRRQGLGHTGRINCIRLC
jgi:hypothetical protein